MFASSQQTYDAIIITCCSIGLCPSILCSDLAHCLLWYCSMFHPLEQCPCCLPAVILACVLPSRAVPMLPTCCDTGLCSALLSSVHAAYLMWYWLVFYPLEQCPCCLPDEILACVLPSWAVSMPRTCCDTGFFVLPSWAVSMLPTCCDTGLCSTLLSSVHATYLLWYWFLFYPLEQCPCYLPAVILVCVLPSWAVCMLPTCCDTGLCSTLLSSVHATYLLWYLSLWSFALHLGSCYCPRWCYSWSGRCWGPHCCR